MAIEKDISTRTAIEITYTRTGNTLHRQERHGVKDEFNVIFITFNETTNYQGQDALQYLEDLTSSRDSYQALTTQTKTINDAQEESMQDDTDFLTEQVLEIEALLP